MQPSVRIRFAKENDWDEIEQITSQNFSFQREKLQELNGFRALVLEFEGQVIGTCLIQMGEQFENPSLKLLWLWYLATRRTQVSCSSRILVRDSCDLPGRVDSVF